MTDTTNQINGNEAEQYGQQTMPGLTRQTNEDLVMSEERHRVVVRERIPFRSSSKVVVIRNYKKFRREVRETPYSYDLRMRKFGGLYDEVQLMIGRKAKSLRQQQREAKRIEFEKFKLRLGLLLLRGQTMRMQAYFNKYFLDEECLRRMCYERYIEVYTLSLYVTQEYKLKARECFERDIDFRLREAELSTFGDRFVSRVRVIKNVVSQSIAQGGIFGDILGFETLASSINRVGEEAHYFADRFTPTMEGFNETRARLEESVSDLIPEVTRALSTSSNIGDKIGSGLSKLKDMFSNFSDPKFSLIFLGMTYLVIEIAEKELEIKSFGFLKPLIAAIAFIQVGIEAATLFTSWVGSRAEAGFGDWLTVAVQGVVFFCFGCTLDFSSLTKAVKGMGDAVGNCSKLTELFDTVKTWFQNLAVLVGDYFGFELYEWMKPKDDVLHEFLERIAKLNAEYAANPMCITTGFTDEVARLLMELNEFAKNTPITTKNTPVLNAIRNIQDKLAALQKQISDAGMEIGERDEPFFVVLAGAPGIGKTKFTNDLPMRLACKLALTPDELIDLKKSWKNKVYVWPMENKHHDMYRGQPIVLFPDLFCQTDAEGQPGEAVYLVYLVGGQSLQLPAADIIKKQKLWFISKFILACTNQVYIHNKFFKSMHNPDALRRRVNQFAFYQWVNPEYILRDASGKPVVDPATNRVKGYEKDEEMYAKIDRNLVLKAKREGRLKSPWFFRRLSFTTGTFVDDVVYTTKSFYKLIEDEFDNHQKMAEDMRADVLADTEEHVNLCLEKMNGAVNAQTAEYETFKVEMRSVKSPVELEEDPVISRNLKIERERRKDFIDKITVDRYGRNRVKEAAKARRDGEVDIDAIITNSIKSKKPGKTMLDYTDFEVEDGFETAEDMPSLETDEEIEQWEEIMEGVSQMNNGEVRINGEYNPRNIIEELRADRAALHAVNPPPLVEVANEAHLRLVDQNREHYIGSFISRVTALGNYHVSDEVYAELIRVHRQWRNHVLREMPINNDQLHAFATLRNKNWNLISAQEWFRCLHHFSSALENNEILKGMYHEFKIMDMIYFGYLPRDQIDAVCTTRRFNYYYNDGVLGRLNEVYHLLSGFATSVKASAQRILTPVYTTVSNAATRFNVWFWQTYFNNPLFNIVVTNVAAFTTSVLCMIGCIELINYLFPPKETAGQKKARKKREREEEEEKFITPQASFDSPSRLTDLLIDYNDNFVGFYIAVHRPDKEDVLTRLPCMALFLNRRTAIMVNHGKEGLVEIDNQLKKYPGSYVEVVLIPYRVSDPDRATERFRMKDIVFDQTDLMKAYDLTAVTFKHARNRPNISKFIPPVDVLEKMLREENLQGTFYERPFNSKYLFTGNCKTRDVWFNKGKYPNNYGSELKGEWFETKQLTRYSYKALVMTGRSEIMETRVGYCGMTGWLEDPRRNKFVNDGFPQACQPWLIYFHTSSQGIVPNGVPLFKEMFEKYLKEDIPFVVKPVLQSVEENLAVYSEMAEKHLGLPRAEHSNFEVFREVKSIDVNHQQIGFINHGWFSPAKSEIKKTELFDKEENTRWPALLRDVTLHGEHLQVMKNAREAYGSNTKLTNQVLIDQILHQLAARIMTDSSKPINTNLLNIEQCIYGDAGYSLNSVNWGSSMGFYLRMIKDKYNQKWKGKTWMKGDDDKLKPEVFNFINALFEHFDAKLRAGEAIGGVNIDNLKDELLAKKKVLEGNSRLFCTSDFIELLLFKKYTGAFCGWIYENRVRNGIAIGVNPYSTEWDAGMEKLLLNSPQAMFFDHKKFDKNQLRQVMKIILIQMTLYYNDAGSVEEVVRELLFESIVNSIHVVCIDGKLVFYRWDQGNTSGNFWTAVLNSLVNWAYMYICSIFAWLIHQGIDPFLLDVLPKNPCDKALQILDLGDDVIATIKSNVMEGVNFNTIVACGQHYLGITITDELKSEGGNIPDFRPLEGGSFLGRTIVREITPAGVRWRGVLRRYSVLERNFWYRGTFDPMEAVANIESSFLEAAIDPNPAFHSYCVKKFAMPCKHFYGVFPKFTDYATARKYILTLATYKWEFNDFKLDINDEFPDLRKILAFASKVPVEPTLEIFGPCVMPEPSALVVYDEGKNTADEESPGAENNAISTGFLRRL